MTTPTTEQLLQTARSQGRREYSTNLISRAAIDLLADSAPVTPSALAEATGVTIDQIRTHVEHVRGEGAEIEDGAIVGLALTLRPTGHRFRVRGNDLYTWCGFDTLFLPIILGEPAQVASTCPVTGTEIRLSVEPDGTASAADPETTVVGIVGEEVTSGCSVSGPDSAICTQMPLFASREAGQRWLADHPGVAIVDLPEAREVARAYLQEDG